MITTEHDTGIHVFVFCCADYATLLDDCIESIEKFTLDPIISRYVVSNIPLKADGYITIQDKNFWNLIDTKGEHFKLYNNHNWIKQQILKLNVDKIVTGNVLIVDAEVRFIKPVKWLDKNKCKIFYDNFFKKMCSSKFIEKALQIESDISKSYITEAIIFSTDKLIELRLLVEKIHATSQISAYEKILFANDIQLVSPQMFMSEYDMYVNYLISFHKDSISKFIHKRGNFYSVKPKMKSWDPNSQTNWINFYEQIRGIDWPDCYSENDLSSLPKEIQQECKDIFGYTPKN